MQLWIQAPFRDATMILNAEDNLIVPETVITKPVGRLDRASMVNALIRIVCPCRVAVVSCCKYCKCKADENCKKSNNRKFISITFKMIHINHEIFLFLLCCCFKIIYINH